MFVHRPRGRPQPSNRGATTTARSAVDRLARAAQEKTINALAVEGYPCQYFAHKRIGTRCTCTGAGSTPAPVLPATPGITVLDAEGNATPNQIRALLQGSTISINRYGTRGQKLPVEPVPALTEPAFETQVHPQTNKTTDGDDGFAEFLEPSTDLDDLLGDAGGSSYTDIQGQSGCGVCLGTGFVGGYNLVNGLRVVYDTQHAWASNGFITKSEAPAYFEAITAAVAQTFILIPLGAASLRALRIWNNKEVQTGYTLEIQVDDTWVTADARTVMSQADGRLHALRLRAPQGFQYTHLEVVFELKLAPLYVEWNRLTQSENPRLPENTESISVVISPTVPQVNIYDILIDSTYHRVWKITSVTNFRDRRLRVHGWEVQLRLVQEFEYPQLLRNSIPVSRHHEFTNALVPAAAVDDQHTHHDVPTR